MFSHQLKQNDKNFKKENFMGQKLINIWDVNVDYIVISNLFEIKTNSKYLIEHFDKVIKLYSHIVMRF